MTFSIVARDGDAYGVAVASRFLAVGAIVPAARIGTGAVATQSFARVAYGPELLDALTGGATAVDALATATAADTLREQRQIGVVGPDDSATFTGSACMAWAGGRSGGDPRSGYAIQGNILVGPEVVAQMEGSWLGSAGAPFTRRLLAALRAGDAAGGDARGRQGSALYAVQPGRGYDHCGVLADLRVDDHPDATTELTRVHDLHDLYFGEPEDIRPLIWPLTEEVRARLARLGYRSGEVADDLARWVGEANLEMRLSPDGIDARVLAELRRVS